MLRKSSSVLLLFFFLVIFSDERLNSVSEIRARISQMAVLFVTTVNLHWIYRELLSSP